jgi:hypothetical protein
MLYRAIIAVCSEIHTELINALCGQNVEFLMPHLPVRKVTTGRTHSTQPFLIFEWLKLLLDLLVLSFYRSTVYPIITGMCAGEWDLKMVAKCD